MNILSIILIVIAALIALPLIAALFIKKDYSIREQSSISRPVADVFMYVKHVKNQEHYSKWVMADPAMQKTFTGTDGSVGFIYAWDSQDNNVGAGEQEITALEPNRKVNTEIRFKRPFTGTAYVTFLTDATGPNETTVSWTMEGSSKYPMNIVNLFMDKVLHRDMQVSLQNLKNNLENNN